MRERKIAVIVPCYNVAPYLGKCLDSLLSQVFQDYEIIAVDDGSTDETWDIIQKYCKYYPEHMRGYTKENGGLSSVRNFGNTKTKADYITYVDSDDYVDPDFLGKLYRASVKGEMDIVLSGRQKVNASGEVLEDLGYEIPTKLRRLTTHGVLYRRAYIEQIDFQFPEGKVYEDNPYNMVAFFQTRRLSVTNYSGYYQLVRDNSITAKKINPVTLPLEALEEACRYVQSHLDRVRDRYLFELTFVSFLTYFIFKANKGHLSVKENRKSDRKVMMQLCTWAQDLVFTYFPEIRRNPYICLFKNNGVPAVQRIGCWGFHVLCRTRLLKPFVQLYYLI